MCIRTLVLHCSVAKSCPTLFDPMNCSTPGFSVLHYFPEFSQTQFIQSVIQFNLSNHLILCCPLLLPSIFPSIRVFSSESALHTRWPKYWSFSFSISLYNEYSGLISFRIDFGAQENKICHCFHCFPICHEVIGLDAMILVFWMLSFELAFPLSSFNFIKRLFSSSLFSAIRVISSAYLRLLIFLPEIFVILASSCLSSSW